MTIMNQVSSLLFLAIAQLFLPPTLATDSIFDTKLYKLKNAAYFLCPLIFDPAQISGQKNVKDILVEKGPFYTLQVKRALAGKAQSDAKKSTCGCCKSIGYFLMKWTLYVGLLGIVALFGFVKGEEKRRLGSSTEDNDDDIENKINRSEKVDIPPFTEISNSGKVIWEQYKPYYVKTMNLWESIVTTFNSNPRLFISEAVLIVIGLCLLTFYLISRRRRHVEKGRHLTIQGVQCGLVEGDARSKDHHDDDERRMKRRKVGWGRRGKVVRQKVPAAWKGQQGWSGFSQFFGAKWEGGKMKKKKIASRGERMKRGANLKQLVQKWTPKRKVALSAAAVSDSDNPTVLVMASSQDQKKLKV